MRILIGVTGGVAAYKAVELARLCVKAGHAVRVVQSPASLRFVGRAAFSAITGGPVLASEFEEDPARGSWPGEEIPVHAPISHLALVDRADVFVVAPATANSISRLAAGAGEDLVTTSALAATCPVIVAPAMNGKMWEGAANLSSVDSLRSRGFHVLDPVEGVLASHGEQGKGRLVEPAAILEEIERVASGTVKDLSGRSVLISAGGTREAIDAVRYIGNRSSGKMGFALAAECVRRGARVTLVAANVALEPPTAVETIAVVSADQMELELGSRFSDCDVLLMAAAVADFRPITEANGKIDKSEGVPRLELEPVNDIIASLSAEKDQQVVIGFAAEHGCDTERARAKMERKGIDAIVYNDVSDQTIGFDSNDNAVTLITAETEVAIERRPKPQIASAIVDLAVDLLSR